MVATCSSFRTPSLLAQIGNIIAQMYCANISLFVPVCAFVATGFDTRNQFYFAFLIFYLVNYIVHYDRITVILFI